ncbi:MAG TPA: ABC transporter permease [Chitinophagaceae bacterium]|nr:ABC transporter permease [Chitinophagaceae bacterium]MCB9056624.1 ABC transporter permease [Chitinophagales bacterium]HPG10675.1 ABC transporter permease [Chitinophagaceae bacterium]
MLVQIAWRNIWRNKIRSLVIIIAVILGLWGGIFSDAFMQGMAEQQVYSSIHTETGHLQLNAPGFLLNHDMQLRIGDADSVVEQINRLPETEAAAATIQITAMASTASSSTGIIVNGIAPDTYAKVSDISKLMVNGDYFKNDRKNMVVVGQQLADKLRVKLHSRIVLTLQTVTGDIIYGAFKIEGIYRTHNSEFDKQMIYVQKDDLQSLVGFPSGAASLVRVLLQKDDDTKEVAEKLRSQFPAEQVQTWIELSPMQQVLSGTMTQMTIIFVGIILIALAFGIVNTMLMAVMDRTREIGMLLSIGMRPSKVFGMIVLETVFLSLTGAVVGILISIGTIYWFGKSGINLSMIAQGANAMGYNSVVYPTLGAGFYFQLAIMVVVVAIIAGLIPARRAIRLKPAEAVRGD